MGRILSNMYAYIKKILLVDIVLVTLASADGLVSSLVGEIVSESLQYKKFGLNILVCIIYCLYL